MGDYHAITTKRGYDFFEVSSAFQKSVRRGLDEEAMYWAVELSESGFGNYLWKRIRIISSEDIGLAEPMLHVQIRILYDNWVEQSKEDKKTGKTSNRLFIAHAVLLLARAKKSRLVDHFNIVHFRTHHEVKKEIPDWALDKHTRRGKKLKRGFRHFFDEGGRLENENRQPGDDEYLERVMRLLIRPEPGDQQELF